MIVQMTNDEAPMTNEPCIGFTEWSFGFRPSSLSGDSKLVIYDYSVSIMPSVLGGRGVRPGAAKRPDPAQEEDGSGEYVGGGH
jgi:hypothetical protein